MASLHFNEHPLTRDLFNVSEKEIEGKFKGWKENADYTVRVTVVLQVDTTNVSAEEQQIAPNITFIATNQAIINIYKVWQQWYVSFSEFQQYYAIREAALERYIKELLARLNTSRHNQGLYGEWYINYSLDERHIGVREAVGGTEWKSR